MLNWNINSHLFCCRRKNLELTYWLVQYISDYMSVGSAANVQIKRWQWKTHAGWPLFSNTWFDLRLSVWQLKGGNAGIPKITPSDCTTDSTCICKRTQCCSDWLIQDIFKIGWMIVRQDQLQWCPLPVVFTVQQRQYQSGIQCQGLQKEKDNEWFVFCFPTVSQILSRIGSGYVYSVWSKPNHMWNVEESQTEGSG